MRKRMNNAARPPLTGRQIRDGMAIHFLNQIWSKHHKGYVFLAAMDRGTGKWIDHAIKIDNIEDSSAKFLHSYSPEFYELFYCPNAFSDSRRLREFVLPSSFAWCDIDDADPNAFVPLPSVLVETSPGRFQGVWNFVGKMPVDRCEAVSRAFAYDHGADRTGWSATKMLRLPWTVNHKPRYSRPSVKLLRLDRAPIRTWPEVLRSHHRAVIAANRIAQLAPAELNRNIDRPPKSLIWKYRRRLAPFPSNLIRNPLSFWEDRS